MLALKHIAGETAKVMSMHAEAFAPRTSRARKYYRRPVLSSSSVSGAASKMFIGILTSYRLPCAHF